MNPSDIFGCGHKSILDITNIYEELIKISTVQTTKSPFKSTLTGLRAQVKTIKGKEYYVNDMVMMNKKQYHRREENIEIKINNRCHIPLELIIFYFITFQEYVKTIIIFDDNFTLQIKECEAKLICMHDEIEYRDYMSVYRDKDSFNFVRIISDHYYNLYFQKMKPWRKYYDSNSGPAFATIARQHFTHRLITPCEIYYTILNHWKVKYRDNNEYVESSKLPYIFIPENNNKIFKTTICMSDLPPPPFSIEANICKFVFKDSGYTIRPLQNSLRGLGNKTYVKILIVPNNILEDCSVFDAGGKLEIPHKITLCGINHIYSYIDNIFGMGDYARQEQQELIRIFDAKNYEGIIRVLDDIEVY